MTIQDVFGDALQPDPAIALQPVQIPIRKRSGPMPRLQFVIEFVGPRSVSAATAANLLMPNWRAALGDPRAFAMSAADVEWQPLTPTVAGSYDSLALAWDLLGSQGQLSALSAQHLLATAEQFALQIQRRAMPMPVPEDVPKALAQLHQIQQNFNAGVSLLVLPQSQQVSEFELCVWCGKLGLTPNFAEGTFDWIVPASPLPLFTVSPVGETESFTLEAAKRGDQCEGALIGFSIPQCPEPKAALEAMFSSADALAQKMSGKVYDEDSRPLTDAAKQTMRQQLAEVAAALEKVGIAPGSPEAMILFA